MGRCSVSTTELTLEGCSPLLERLAMPDAVVLGALRYGAPRTAHLGRNVSLMTVSH